MKARHHRRTLPAWMREEDQLRRLLRLRKEGAGLREALDTCGMTLHEWRRVREVARGHGGNGYAGDQKVAQAFLRRFDEYGLPPRGRPLFTPEEGTLLAGDIARWRVE